MYICACVCVCTFVSSLPLALFHIIVVSCIVNLSQICGYICMYVEPWYVYNWYSAWFVCSCQPLLPALLFLKPICITVRALIVVHVEFNQLQLENAYKTTDNFKPVQILFGLLNKREKPKLGRVIRHLSIEPCMLLQLKIFISNLVENFTKDNSNRSWQIYVCLIS